MNPTIGTPRRSRSPITILAAVAVTLAAGATAPHPAFAQAGFPRIPMWSFPGAYQAGPDSIREQARTLTVRWLRDPAAEAREDFGGYRIYRVFHTPDTTFMSLVRRFSVQFQDSVFLWHFPRIDGSTPESQRIATFIDPDSNGHFVKVCRKVDHLGRCLTPGDSIIVLIPPPGPHDGFRTWYSITYEGRNTVSYDYLDLFLPDTIHCSNPDRRQCPNLNHKALNRIAQPVEPTSGPTSNLEQVAVVPNPFRGVEAWDLPNGNEVHFINLPERAKILIYTVSGDLVAELEHADSVHDFERWDLKNQQGRVVGSGIYLYRVVSGGFTFQNRLVVIR